MNNITITYEMCEADRARIDRLIAALEHRPNCEGGVTSAKEMVDAARTTPSEADPMSEALAKMRDRKPTPTETAQETAEATETAEAPVTPPIEEKATEEAQPSVSLEQIQQKVTQLAAANKGAKKAKVRDIIYAYGSKVSDLKDQPGKWAEIWGKLIALESEE